MSQGFTDSPIPVSLVTDVTGTLPVGNGGTGATSFTSDAILTGNTTSAIVAESTLTYDGTTLTLDGGQIAFPATQAASSGANTLDDYEEGSWTPAIGGSGGQSGQVHDIQTGNYIKVGKIVALYGYVRVSTLGTITGVVQISGLPFTSANVTNLDYGGVAIWEGLTTAVGSMSILNLGNTSIVRLYNAIGDQTTGENTFAQGNLSNTSGFRITIVYQAAA